MIGDNITNQRTSNETTNQLIRSIRGFVSKFVGSYTEREARGFTLMEMLVSLGLFAIVVTVATDLFLSFQRASRKTENLEAMVGSARLTLERVASAVRESTIDYARYVQEGVDLTVARGQPVLYLLNPNEESVRFRYADCAEDREGRDCLQLEGPTGSESITSAKLRVRDAQFFIYPSGDPSRFVTIEGEDRRGQYAADAQARATVFLSLDTGLSPPDSNYVRYDVQTTISSRVYQR